MKDPGDEAFEQEWGEAHEEMPAGLVIVATFDSAWQANLLRGKLEDEGIPAYIFDENTVTLNPLYSIAVGGIKVKVREPDYEAALAVYKEVNNAPHTNEDNEPVTCPYCGSAHIEAGRGLRSTGAFASFIISILTFTYPLHRDELYTCQDCGKEFAKK